MDQPCLYILAMKNRNNTDFAQNQLLFPVAHKLASDPGSPVEGQFYYHTGKQLIYVYTGTVWVPCGWSTHEHPISDITNLQSVLDNKTPYGHTHYLRDIVDWEEGIAPLQHTHPISDIFDLQLSLDSKASSSHSHVISSITGLQTALDGKSVLGHGHAISDIATLQTTLDSKSDKGHGHAISDVTGLQASLDAKAAASHSHAISDVTNLQSSLNAKLDKSGGAMAGAFVAYAHGTATNFEVVNVAYGTGSTPPSGPSEGCIYIQYT